MLRNQLKQLQDELRQTDRNLTKSQANKQVLMGKIGKLGTLALIHALLHLVMQFSIDLQMNLTYTSITHRES